MRKKQKTCVIKLDRNEKELLASFENDEWKSVKNLKKEKNAARKAAARTLYRYAAGHLPHA